MKTAINSLIRLKYFTLCIYILLSFYAEKYTYIYLSLRLTEYLIKIAQVYKRSHARSTSTDFFIITDLQQKSDKRKEVSTSTTATTYRFKLHMCEQLTVTVAGKCEHKTTCR